MPQIFFAFKKYAESNLDTVVQWFAGPHTHVDIVVGNKAHMYTAFIGEPFSRNTLDRYTPETHDVLTMDVTESQHANAENTMKAWVLMKIPYNFDDVLRFAVPYFQHDEDVQDPVTSLFCSQAVVLLIRKTMPIDDSQRQAVESLNSRTVTPTRLYEIMKENLKSSDELYHI